MGTVAGVWMQKRWLHAAYTYSDVSYKEAGVMTEQGRFGGARGELGLNLFSFFALSARGEYHDGNMNYNGTTLTGSTVRQITRDYVREWQGLGHFLYGPIALSVGVGERYWFNDLVGSYRRRTRYNYTPVAITVVQPGGVYYRYEHVVWGKGWSKSHMTDAGAARDVELNLGKGTGSKTEVGYMMYGSLWVTHVFVSMQKWDVKGSNTLNDGTRDVTHARSSTTIWQAGIGFAF
jgi:hypothetical protein